MLRCPLCLQRIEDGSQIVRYCSRHDAPDTKHVARESGLPPNEVRISTEDVSGIHCPGYSRHDGCVPSPLIEHGTFLFHGGCRCTSPFLTPSSTIDVENRQRLMDGTNVDHWQIKKAKEIARIFPRPEMWFPQALFRAANEHKNGHPFGCFVMLAGAQSAGKTVLSLMAMNHWSYPGSELVQHYAHITESGASNEDFLGVLNALEQIRELKLRQTMIPTTVANLTNIKCVFLPFAQPPPARRALTAPSWTSGI